MERMFEEFKTIRTFFSDTVEIEQEGIRKFLDPFHTVVLASGMVSTPAPDEEIRKSVSKIEIIGDAREVKDIFCRYAGWLSVSHKY